ncbi:MAG TPA: hypothetical protein PLD58_21490 [Phycisphaerae bacterium]|nr:hypothetical protein [Phycisphaerae bacterium]
MGWRSAGKRFLGHRWWIGWLPILFASQIRSSTVDVIHIGIPQRTLGQYRSRQIQAE